MSETSRFRDPAKQSMVLTALYIAQEQYGYLSEEALTRVAERLDIPVAAVYSTASFYSLLHTQAKGRYHIQVCEGISCALCGGAEHMLAYIRDKLGIAPGEITPDGLFSLEVVQCLASCGTSPAVRVNDELYDDLTFDKVDRMLDQLAQREEA
ncbi:MAG: NAD(P)H-dependent oxidoreductase subunit E [Anaerolineae bacterium]|nr:NAD(P)H-dependent oxidoreductase subunit E [Anaerolineae bacterium]